MKKVLLVAVLLLSLASCGEKKEVYKDPDASIEDRVSDLLGRMTLKEKILQLSQYTLGNNNNENNVGVVNSIPAEIGSLIYFDEDPELRNMMQKHAVEESRLGIPILFGYDVIHGFKTIYQISLGQGCSFNPELAEAACHNAAIEARSSGVEWTFSPMIDVAHDPRWGRVSEGYGEDPYLNALFAAASVKGYQGDDPSAPDRVAACLKHYIGYGASEAGRDYVYTEISRQSLWDTYMPPYEAGVRAGALTLMSSFNDISGTPATANEYTLTEVLKKKWNHEGFVVSDWGAVGQLIPQGMASDLKEATELSINAGLDMDMMSHAFDSNLEELVNEGKVSMSRIDDAVSRILTVKFRLGLFENPYTPAVKDASRFYSEEAKKASVDMALESIVLLKNSNVLPLNGQKIALIGPMADNGRDIAGNWAAHVDASGTKTVFASFKEAFGESMVSCAKGCETDSMDVSLAAEAERTARAADVAVLCLGEKFNWSGENCSRASISLPEAQQKLAERIYATGKKVVILLFNGRPLDLTRLEPYADAIVECWQPGTFGSEAIARLIGGKDNFSGKLDITFPRGIGQIPIYYNRRQSSRPDQGYYQDMSIEPMYSFGYGLSYSDITYGDLKTDKTEFTSGEKVNVSVEVSNNSDMDKKEAVLWFISDPYSKITRPLKELRHVEKRNIKAHSSETFTFEIDPKADLSGVNENGDRILEKGLFHVMAGDKSVDITLK